MPAVLEENYTSLADVLEIEIDVAIERSAALRPSDAERYVTFFIGEDLYAIAADQVAEVTHPLPVSPLPNGPEFIVGISPLRGEIVAVVDLNRMLGEVPAPPVSSARTKLVILRANENESQPAFRVDRMHELMAFGSGELNESAAPHTVIQQSATSGGRNIKIVRPSALREALHS